MSENEVRGNPQGGEKMMAWYLVVRKGGRKERARDCAGKTKKGRRKPLNSKEREKEKPDLRIRR